MEQKLEEVVERAVNAANSDIQTAKTFVTDTAAEIVPVEQQNTGFSIKNIRKWFKKPNPDKRFAYIFKDFENETKLYFSLFEMPKNMWGLFYELIKADRNIAYSSVADAVLMYPIVKNSLGREVLGFSPTEEKEMLISSLFSRFALAFIDKSGLQSGSEEEVKATWERIYNYPNSNAEILTRLSASKNVVDAVNDCRLFQRYSNNISGRLLSYPENRETPPGKMASLLKVVSDFQTGVSKQREALNNSKKAEIPSKILADMVLRATDSTDPKSFPIHISRDGNSHYEGVEYEVGPVNYLIQMTKNKRRRPEQNTPDFYFEEEEKPLLVMPRHAAGT